MPEPRPTVHRAPAAPHPRAVFVYGTLRPGNGNDRLWRGRDKSHRNATVDGFTVYDGGGFPYALETETNAPAVGTLIEFSKSNWPDVLASLDRLEGYPDHYRRVVTDALTDDGDCVPCWVYVAARAEWVANLPVCTDGEWSPRRWPKGYRETPDVDAAGRPWWETYRYDGADPERPFTDDDVEAAWVNESGAAEDDRALADLIADDLAGLDDEDLIALGFVLDNPTDPPADEDDDGFAWEYQEPDPTPERRSTRSERHGRDLFREVGTRWRPARRTYGRTGSTSTARGTGQTRPAAGTVTSRADAEADRIADKAKADRLAKVAELREWMEDHK